jgi:LytS/YehU family sensor histidine kinase
VSSSLFEVHGEPHLLYITKDITDRKRAEDQLRVSEANLAATINNTSTVIWSMDENYILIAQNEASRQFTKTYYGRILEIGDTIHLLEDVVALEERRFWDEKYKRVLQGEHIVCFNEGFGKKFETSINPIRANGNIVGLTVYVVDVTERIAREQQVVRHLEQLAEAEKRIGELKLMSLRSAMNPHFIFNALNAIQFFISNNERSQAIQFLSKFSRLIRGILTASSQATVLLAEELDLLQKYVELEQIRFENKFEVKFYIDPTIDLSITIPSLLVQPFVENAIVHGLSNAESGGHLKISIEKSDKTHLMFKVEDDGIGRVAAMKLKKMQGTPHQSLGISLAEERLKLINRGAELLIETEDLYHQGKPCGTCVRVWFEICD